MKKINKLTALAMMATMGWVSLTGCQKTADTAQTASDTPAAHDAHSHAEHEQMTSEPAEALGQDYSLYQIGGEWQDQNATMHSLDELRGKYQVVAMAYTSCQHTCPFIVRSIKQIERALTPQALANTSFTLVTFDTQRDTPEVMANHFKHNELNDNWRWLRSDDANTRMLANTLNIKYHYAENGDINHSNTISILDKEGRLVAQGNGVADSGIKPLIEYLNTNAQ
ncbi:SCO family protein [Moraxella marmotae]|uniref:SCO family protein n=1 Tax=Moraxella marmotae TaxID=3344520 RepID=UPI0035F329AE